MPEDGFPEDIQETAGALFENRNDAEHINCSILVAEIVNQLLMEVETPGLSREYTENNIIPGNMIVITDGQCTREAYAESIAPDGRPVSYTHLPHHGTESHFFDFSSFSPENMMIPNGAYYDNSKKKSKNQRTSMQYGGLFYINDAHMYCSNCDCCDSYENGCSCREYDVISPSYYKDI